MFAFVATFSTYLSKNTNLFTSITGCYGPLLLRFLPMWAYNTTDKFSVLECEKTYRHKAQELLHCFRFTILHFSFLKTFYFRMKNALFGKREKLTRGTTMQD